MKLIVENPKDYDQYFELTAGRNTWWIGTQDGEGMELDQQQFFDFLKKFYDDTF